MVSVTADHIRKRLGLTVADTSEEDVLAFRDEAIAFLGEGIGKTKMFWFGVGMLADDLIDIPRRYRRLFTFGEEGART